MDLLKSAWLFILGILKRFYWLAPSILSDPFDITERWFQVNYQLPPFTFYILLFVGFLIASILAYHELRTQKVKNESNIDATSVKDFEIVWLGGNFVSRDTGLVYEPKIRINTLKMIQVQSMVLEVNNQKIPSYFDGNDVMMIPESVTLDDVKFEFPLDAPRGRQIARLRTIADGRETISKSFFIDFPQRKGDRAGTTPTSDKLALVVRAITEAKQIIPEGYDTFVLISDKNHLSSIEPLELLSILLKLQNDEKILKLKSFPKWLLPNYDMQMGDPDYDILKEIGIAEPQEYKFVVSLEEKFDEWLKNFKPG